MRILLIHPEKTYFAGAECVLRYFLSESAAQNRYEVAIAVAQDSRMEKLLPPAIKKVFIEDNRRFSMHRLWGQAQKLKEFRRQFPFDLVHGWAARDWELASLVGWLCDCPAIGSLFDHPHATFISGKRQWLMRCCAKWGLKKTICPSLAVQRACIQAGYPAQKLTFIHSGLPAISGNLIEHSSGPFRIGFLGVFSERKGLRDLFQIMDKLADQGDKPCEWHLAGNAQDESGESLLEELRNRYEANTWWKNIHWHGWIESPQNFMKKIDLLITPSSEFDPFPTVLLEAAQVGLPVLAASVGGVPEIVIDGQTGWLFEPGNVNQAVQILEHIITLQPDLRHRVGNQAVQRSAIMFSAAKMVAEHSGIYSTLLENV